MTQEIPERMPWCTECDCYAVPDENGECGDCGTEIVYREGQP